MAPRIRSSRMLRAGLGIGCCLLLPHAHAQDSGADLPAESAPPVLSAAPVPSPAPPAASPSKIPAPIEVLAPRPLDAPTPARDLPAFVSSFPLEHLPFQTATLSDYVSLSPGVQVLRSGGPGRHAQLLVRGASGGQLLILLDGMPVGFSSLGDNNLEALSVGQLERIELYRGSSPLAFGSNAMGGVLNLVSRSSARPLELRATSSLGSFGDRRFGLSLGQTTGALDWRGGLNAHSSQGNYPYYRDNGTPYTLDDDQIEPLKNNHVTQVDGSFQLRGPLPEGGRLTLSSSLLSRDLGVLGLGQGQLETAARYSLQRAQLGLQAMGGGMQAHLPQGAWPALPAPAQRPPPEAPSGGTPFVLTLHQQLEALLQTDRFSDPLGEVSLAPTDRRQQALELGSLSRAQLWPGTHHAIEAVLVLRHERAVAQLLDPAGALLSSETHWRTRLGAGLEDRWTLHALRLVPGLLVDRVQGAELERQWLTSPRLGLELSLARAVPGLKLKSNGGAFHRLPTFLELYGNQGSLVGNPQLRPEQGLNLDAGFEWQFAAADTRSVGQLEGVGFLSRSTDLVVYDQNSQNTLKPVNVAAAETVGVELSAAVELEKRLTARGAYTWLRAIDRSGIPAQDGLQLPGRPRHRLNLLLSTQLGPLGLYYRLDGASEVALEASHTRLSPPRILHDVGLKLEGEPTWRVRWSASLELQNLLDTFYQPLGDGRSPQPVMDSLGFPLPGRSWHLSLSCHW